ncbi:MAG: OmpA family protein [Phaeodactylibacter sp.]|nr:OmpA family protein [Phaeodactylibacter sp.]MCB9049678.1 OmpA family protein [Lewinellaceae bacterium]
MTTTVRILFFLLFSAALFSSSCNTSRAAKGAVIGGTAGGVAGGAIGKKSGNTAAGIIIGSAIGGTAGALIGNYMDKQAKEIERDMKGATVKRVGEGILITFDSGLMFDVNSSQLRSATKSNLEELSRVLQKYEDTNILIEGHTDSSGSEEYNQELSEKRASSVYTYLVQQGVMASRFSTIGYGEMQPVATNETPAGRQQNRRVEVAIYANKKLQKAAKRGDIGQ